MRRSFLDYRDFSGLSLNDDRGSTKRQRVGRDSSSENESDDDDDSDNGYDGTFYEEQLWKRIKLLEANLRSEQETNASMRESIYKLRTVIRNLEKQNTQLRSEVAEESKQRQRLERAEESRLRNTSIAR